MMARYQSRGMAIRPVQRIKHVVDNSATLASGSTLPIGIINAVDAPLISAPINVITGAKVNGVYIKVIVASNEAQVTGAIPNVYMIIYKNPGNNLTLPAPNAVGVSDNKKHVIHQEMVMIDNKVSGQPTVLFNGVVVIPKGMRRFGPSDRLDVAVLCPAINISVCLQAHYKEFR